VLSDIPPRQAVPQAVHALVDLGAWPPPYRWEMGKIGVGSVDLQTIYTSNYVSNRTKGTVVDVAQ